MMQCVTGVGYGDEEQLRFEREWPRPKRRRGKRELLVRVQACALAPGDVRVLSGQVSLLQGPKSFPYVVGGDVCGVIAEVDDDDSDFSVGDEVVARFAGFGPHFGLAEYVVVKRWQAAKKPSNLTACEAAALGSSAVAAMALATRYVGKGDRVLVLGANGGVGTTLVQLLKAEGAAYVAGTAAAADGIAARLEALGVVDRVIKYDEEKWWEACRGQPPFDVIFDLAGGESWRRARKSRPRLLRRDGRYVALAFENPHPVIKSILQMVWITVQLAVFTLGNKLNPYSPPYIAAQAIPGPSSKDSSQLAATVQAAEQGRFKVVLDPSGPFPFSLEGARSAFRKQASRHTFGKVVIQVS